MAVAVKSTEELTKQKKPLTRQRRVVVTGTSVFPAIEVMETLDKAKCVVLIGSRMGGMKGWMVPNYSTSTACATSTFCTLNSANHIIKAKALTQDLMLCGGLDSVMIPLGMGGFVACRALSQRNNDPTKASRPWDSVMRPITVLDSFILLFPL
ncbi:hypothetical protein ACFX1S_026924 [Malus domestica]